MSTITSTFHKVIQNQRVLLTGLIIILGAAVTTGFIWMHIDHVIAPPGLRLMDALWKFFICRCPNFPNTFGF